MPAPRPLAAPSKPFCAGSLGMVREPVFAAIRKPDRSGLRARRSRFSDPVDRGGRRLRTPVRLVTSWPSVCDPGDAAGTVLVASCLSARNPAGCPRTSATRFATTWTLTSTRDRPPRTVAGIAMEFAMHRSRARGYARNARAAKRAGHTSVSPEVSDAQQPRQELRRGLQRRCSDEPEKVNEFEPSRASSQRDCSRPLVDREQLFSTLVARCTIITCPRCRPPHLGSPAAG